MNRLPLIRIEKLTAIVAAWAIVLAPLTTFSNCCCAARAATTQAAAPEQADEEERLEPLSCCAAAPSDVCVSEPAPSCCTPAATGQSAPSSSLKSCSCQTHCCDTNVSQAAAIVSSTGQQSVSLDWDAPIAALLGELPWEPRSTWSEAARDPGFLSAHTRCAMLCRWLN